MNKTITIEFKNMHFSRFALELNLHFYVGVLHSYVRFPVNRFNLTF